MKMDDFTHGSASWINHKIYPITVFRHYENKWGSWFYDFFSDPDKTVEIKELWGINPEDVSDELFNLIILKYSML